MMYFLVIVGFALAIAVVAVQSGAIFAGGTVIIAIGTAAHHLANEIHNLKQ
jgi:hypothetical protein